MNHLLIIDPQNDFFDIPGADKRGLNENHNGLLRQFFPKQTNLPG